MTSEFAELLLLLFPLLPLLPNSGWYPEECVYGDGGGWTDDTHVIAGVIADVIDNIKGESGFFGIGELGSECVGNGEPWGGGDIAGPGEIDGIW